jgi:hypothetical protein
MSKLIIYFIPLNLKSQWSSSSCLGWFKMIVAEYVNCLRKFMWQLCEWDRVDICMKFHKRAFDFLNFITHWFDNFENCATMNCQKNVNSIPPTRLPHRFLYMVARFIDNYFESPNIYISIARSMFKQTIRLVWFPISQSAVTWHLCM